MEKRKEFTETHIIRAELRMEKFNLSEKIELASKYHPSPCRDLDVIWTGDVKEFIRRLKEDNMFVKHKGDMNANWIEAWKKKIDALAGDDLK